MSERMDGWIMSERMDGWMDGWIVCSDDREYHADYDDADSGCDDDDDDRDDYNDVYCRDNLFINQSIYFHPSIYYIHLSIHYVHLYIYLPMYISTYLSIRPNLGSRVSLDCLRSRYQKHRRECSYR
jgi:hypothetical protein